MSFRILTFIKHRIISLKITFNLFYYYAMEKYENIEIKVTCTCPRGKSWNINQDIVVGSQESKNGKIEKSFIEVFCPFCDQTEREVEIHGKIPLDRNVDRGN